MTLYAYLFCFHRKLRKEKLSVKGVRIKSHLVTRHFNDSGIGINSILTQDISTKITIKKY